MRKQVRAGEVTVGFPPPCTMGPDAYSGVSGALRPFGHRALLIGGVRALAAGLPLLEEAVSGKGITLSVSPWSGDCTRDKAMQLAHTARSFKADAVLGMGGGRALDTAKAAAFFAGLPVITLPTIPATCAAVTALCVMHETGGSADSSILFLDAPPSHAFLHTGILAASPDMYLRAGIGDSLTKHVESAFKSRGAELAYTDRLGLAAAKAGYETLMSIGVQALRDAAAGHDSAVFRLACQLCILNTGFVSLMVREAFNGALAHSLFYALRDFPGFSECLHGDLVAWGSVVQLMLEGRKLEAAKLAGFLETIGIAPSLQRRGISFPSPELLNLLPGALRQQDMAGTPIAVSEAMLAKAVSEAESLAPLYIEEELDV